MVQDSLALQNNILGFSVQASLSTGLIIDGNKLTQESGYLNVRTFVSNFVLKHESDKNRVIINTHTITSEVFLG